jgi:hypothetical protein
MLKSAGLKQGFVYINMVKKNGKSKWKAGPIVSQRIKSEAQEQNY